VNAPDDDPIVHAVGVVKHYQALRPLRIRDLRVRRGQAVALHGLDKTAAEVLVNMLIGSSLPDEGQVRVFGRVTSDISSSDEWLTWLRRFALFSDRTVLVEELSVEQNLAIPHTLNLDPLAEELRAQVGAVGAEVGLSPEMLAGSLGGLDALQLARVRLARALALEPDLLLAEHPTATLDAAGARAFAGTLTGVVSARRMAAVYLTADQEFAKAVGKDVLTLKPATGEFTSSSGWRRWLS
jgi:ABC-type transporter Mla maintaining outer membrane lipid asymmetry ATPase subunit MlaF